MGIFTTLFGWAVGAKVADTLDGDGSNIVRDAVAFGIGSEIAPIAKGAADAIIDEIENDLDIDLDSDW